MQDFGVVSVERGSMTFVGDHPPVFVPGLLSSGQKYISGTVLARNVTTNKLVQFNPDGNEGTNIPVGILHGDIDATAADEKAMYMVHGVAIDYALIWPEGLTQPQKDEAVIALRDAGVYVK